MKSMLICVLLISPVVGHLCILSPRQRGDLDVSEPGSHTCNRHTGPCGGEMPGTPVYTMRGGRTEVIKWQQNLNHYSVGYPGYMDIALGRPQGGSDPTEWITLAALGDSNEHAQSNQQNYTMTIVPPNMNCEHCVLRMRYVANKPGETPFLQCADVTVHESNVEMSALLPAHAMKMLTPRARRALSYTQRFAADINTPQQLHGFAFNPIKPESSRYQTVDWISGGLSVIGDNINYGFDTGKPYLPGYTPPEKVEGAFLLDQVMAYDPSSDVLTLGLHRKSDLDAMFDSLLRIEASTGKIVENGLMLNASFDGPISCIASLGANEYIFFSIVPDSDKPGSFFFDIYHTADLKSTIRAYRSQTSENLYINYQWSEFNSDTGMLYVLMGNENAPFKLNARIYTYSVNHNKIELYSMKELKVDQFTIQSMHLTKDGKLVSLSPGLITASRYPAWHLVEVSPSSGEVTHLKQVTPSGLFTPKFGGTIVNAVDRNNTLTAVLRTDAGADVLARVGVDTELLQFSSFTNFQHLHNFVIV